LKALALLGLFAGLAIATLLVLTHGAEEIWHSIVALSWAGFVMVIAVHSGLIILMGLAWWFLGRDHAKWPCFAWGRLIRDSASEALPLSQIGGYVLGARAVTLTGVSGAFAAGSTVVDVTIELVAQLGYTIIGLGLLHSVRPQTIIVGPILAGVGVMALLVTMFFAVQAKGAGAVERIGARIAGQLLGREIAGSGAVRTEIQRIHARRGRLLSASLIHLTAWVLSGVETWLTLGFMGIPISLAAALVIDSLLYGMRSVAFMVPNALGVQEGGLVFLCALFGVGADAALALSFIKRGRDLFIGIPALLVWQAIEGRHAWDRMVVGAEEEISARTIVRDP
jgi:glycosyltransferase 2 family protein